MIENIRELEKLKNPEDIIIKTDSLFLDIKYFADSDMWKFSFENDIFLSVESIWRLLSNETIILVSLDNGQLFGLKNPIDAVKSLGFILKEQRLTEAKIKRKTSDLLLTFSNNFQIETFITSTGYESYSLHINNYHYIGMGSGEIAIFKK